MRPTFITFVRFAASIAGAAACAAAMLVLAPRGRDTTIVRSVENGGDWYARSPAWYTTRGIYPTEHAPDGSAYAWAGGRVRLQIPQLDRQVSQTLVIRARSGRAPNEPPTLVRIAVDGIEAEPLTIGADWQELDIDLPVAQRRGATILADTDQTFTPGPKDPRALAFMIDRLTLTRVDGAIRPGARVLTDIAMFAAAVAFAALVCLLPAWIAFAGGVAAGSVAVFLVLFDAAFLGTYGRTFAALALVVAGTASIASLAARVGSSETRRYVRMAAYLTIVITVLKIAVFVHPDSPVSDGMFHVHRAQAVRAGSYI
jgi:hypothetical protein